MAHLRTVLFAALICFSAMALAKTDYPATKKAPVKETLHGVTIVDNYRWLEDGKNPEVAKWTEAQNQFTMKKIGAIPETEKIYSRLKEIWNFDRMDMPVPRGDKLFYTKKIGLQNQGALYMKKGNAEKIVLDPNTLNKEGTTTIDWWYASKNGKMVAYGLSENGSEQSVLHIIDTETGKNLDTPISGCRYASVGWLPDDSGFYYTRKLDGQKSNEIDSFQTIRFHKLGTDPEKDEIIANTTIKEAIIVSSISDDGNWLLISEYKGSSGKARLTLYNAKTKKTTALVDNFDNIYNGEIYKENLYLMTDKDNSLNYKVVKINLKNMKWETFIPEEYASVIQNFTISADRLVVAYMEDVISKVKIFDLKTAKSYEIKFPVIGSLDGLSGETEKGDIYFGYSSFAYPPTIFKYDGQKLAQFFQANVKADPSIIETKQVFYTSKDGTKIPMFIVHKKGIELNGKNPTIIVGYGGFNVSYNPYFSSNNFIWLEKGGIIAVANIRGGGEYGEKWHSEGMMAKKQNCFDDFAWAMKYLTENKYTNPKKLGIKGGSNGGLLTGAMVTQFPELFEAALVAVPLLDMLRFQKFLIGRYWVSEYGSADDAEQFKYIYKYSPYHNVKKGLKYPTVFLTAGENDSRVDPLHAKKMAALLQDETTSENPIYLYVETKAGHGQGVSTEVTMRENAMIWSFFFKELF